MIEHKHLIVKGTYSRLMTNERVLNFLNDLVEILDMKLMDLPNNPNVGYVGGKGSGNTGVAIITTSHIVLHAWEETMDYQLDIYSCKVFDPKVVLSYCNEIGLHEQSVRFFDRNYNTITDEDI